MAQLSQGLGIYKTAPWPLPNIGLGPSAVLGSDQVQKEGMTPDTQPALSCCPSTAAETPVGVGTSCGKQEPWDPSGPRDASGRMGQEQGR